MTNQCGMSSSDIDMVVFLCGAKVVMLPSYQRLCWCEVIITVNTLPFVLRIVGNLQDRQSERDFCDYTGC